MKTIELPKLANCVTIDVGKHTAVAKWDGTKFPVTHEISWRGAIKDVGLYVCDMAKKLNNTLSFMSGPTLFDFVQIEGVGFWDSSEKSRTSASRGDLFTVAYLVGAYTVVAGKFASEVRVVGATQWKGQLSKEGTAARVKRINGMTYSSEHITDAVAMGFSNEEDVWKLKRKLN